MNKSAYKKAYAVANQARQDRGKAFDLYLSIDLLLPTIQQASAVVAPILQTLADCKAALMMFGSSSQAAIEKAYHALRRLEWYLHVAQNSRRAQMRMRVQVPKVEPFTIPVKADRVPLAHVA